MKATTSARKNAITVGVIIAAIYLVIYITLESTKTDKNLGWVDATSAHLPAINWFIVHGFSLHYPAITPISPGLYLLAASISRLLGDATVDLNSWSILILPALLVLASFEINYFALRTIGASPWWAASLMIPIAASKYIWMAALYPLTESLAFFGYAIMAFSAARPRLSAIGFSVGCALATAARQIFFPVSIAGALIAIQQASQSKRPWYAIVQSAVILGPAIFIVGILVLIWGGLIPPGFERHSPSVRFINPIAVVHGLMIVGLFGILFLRPIDFVPSLSIERDILICMIFALAVWLVFDLSASVAGGRWGSVIWTIAAHSPLLFHRPIFLLPLIGMGAFLLKVIWNRGMRDIGRSPPELIIFVCYLLAQAGQAFSWQRYIEFTALTVLAYSQARVRQNDLRFDVPMIAIFIGYFAISAHDL